jgi:hypothetical protein
MTYRENKQTLLALFITAIIMITTLFTQAQINPCDSIEYHIVSSANSNLLHLNGVINGVCPVNFPCVVQDWSWTVCDDALCFSDTGQTVDFSQFMTSDTLKVCLTTIIDYMGVTYSCMEQCDSLVFGPNGWMLMNMGNPTLINELTLNKINDGKIYDMLGRELTKIPVGIMYIRNQKIHITKQ